MSNNLGQQSDYIPMQEEQPMTWQYVEKQKVLEIHFNEGKTEYKQRKPNTGFKIGSYNSRSKNKAK